MKNSNQGTNRNDLQVITGKGNDSHNRAQEIIFSPNLFDNIDELIKLDQESLEEEARRRTLLRVV